VRKSTFLKHIQNLEEEDLREELSLLYDKVKEVKQFYMMELGSTDDRQKRYLKAKQEIIAKFKTKSYRKPRRPRIQKINKIVSELKKISIFGYEMIDIYLFLTETGLTFMKEYRFESIPLENLIVKSYTKAIELIVVSKMEEEYEDRSEMILNDADRFFPINEELEAQFSKAYK